MSKRSDGSQYSGRPRAEFVESLRRPLATSMNPGAPSLRVTHRSHWDG
jgi:hypothetical protein